MISKQTQYRIYAGTSNDDFTGWVQAEAEEGADVELWSLDMGDGYFLDRAVKTVRGFLRKKKVRIYSLRRDRTIEDPEGDYTDMNFSLLFNVKIMVSQDAIKFDSGNNSFVLLSREPADWSEFSEGVPVFEDPKIEENWASFYS